MTNKCLHCDLMRFLRERQQEHGIIEDWDEVVYRLCEVAADFLEVGARIYPDRRDEFAAYFIEIAERFTQELQQQTYKDNMRLPGMFH